MGFYFTPQAKAALRINLVLVASCMALQLVTLPPYSYLLGFLVGTVNYFYVLNQIDKIKH